MAWKSNGSDVQTLTSFGITSTYLPVDHATEKKIISTVNIPLSNEVLPYTSFDQSSIELKSSES